MLRNLSVLCGTLLIANLVLLMWPDSGNSAAHIHAAQKEVNPHFVRLNKEVEDRFYAQKNSINQNQRGVEQGCFRLGPFMHQANYELAQAVLINADIVFEKAKRRSKESDVYRVYLGPYENKTAMQVARAELKSKKILDHFARRQSDGQYLISLGIYSTQSSAQRAIAMFADTLSSVKLKQEQILLPDSFWLHFDIDEENRIYRELVSMDWGERSAKLGKFECQAA